MAEMEAEYQVGGIHMVSKIIERITNDSSGRVEILKWHVDEDVGQ